MKVNYDTTLTLFCLTAVINSTTAQSSFRSNRLVDIGFIVDTSGSFEDDIDLFKAQATAIVTGVTSLYPNAHFGLARFQDIPRNPWGQPGNEAHLLVSDIARPDEIFIDTILSLTTSTTWDAPESQLISLHQSLLGTGLVIPPSSTYSGYTIPPNLNFHFRPGSCRIVILWTDARFHSPLTTPGYPGPTVQDVVNAAYAPATRRRSLRGLQTLRPDSVRIVGLMSGFSSTTRADMSNIAKLTGGVAGVGGLDCDGDGNEDVAAGEGVVCSAHRGITHAVVNMVADIVPQVPEESVPTTSPTESPTRAPIVVVPTASPSAVPSPLPSSAPTATPSILPSVAPSFQPTAPPSSAPTITPGCGVLKGCYLQNLTTGASSPLQRNDVATYTISGHDNYTIRCDVEGRLYNMAFEFDGALIKERQSPYYMNGDRLVEGLFQPYTVPYLEGCGNKEVLIRGRIWAGVCFRQTFLLEAICE